MVVGLAQASQPLALPGQLGEGGIAHRAGSLETHPIAALEIGIDGDQLRQIPLLSPQLLLQCRQIEPKQGLPATNRLAHRHRNLQDLPAGTGVNHLGSSRHDHHATANHLRGHRPEADPTDGERHQPSEGQQHLAFRIGGLATNPAPGISSQHSPPQPLPQMVAHPQGIGDGRE